MDIAWSPVPRSVSGTTNPRSWPIDFTPDGAGKDSFNVEALGWSRTWVAGNAASELVNRVISVRVDHGCFSLCGAHLVVCCDLLLCSLRVTMSLLPQ